MPEQNPIFPESHDPIPQRPASDREVEDHVSGAAAGEPGQGKPGGVVGAAGPTPTKPRFAFPDRCQIEVMAHLQKRHGGAPSHVMAELLDIVAPYVEQALANEAIGDAIRQVRVDWTGDLAYELRHAASYLAGRSPTSRRLILNLAEAVEGRTCA